MQLIEGEVDIPPPSGPQGSTVLADDAHNYAKLTCWGRRNQPWTHLIILIELAFGFIFFYGLARYMPYKLGRGSDFRGMICGQAPLETKPYLYKILPQSDLNLQMCVSECPAVTGQQICLYENDGNTATSFCYQTAASSPHGVFCVQKEHQSKVVVEAQLADPAFFLQRFLSEVVTTLPQYGLALAATLVLAAVVKCLLGHLEHFVVRPLATLSQFVLLGFAACAYQAQTQQVQRQCVAGVDKYNCASSYNSYVLAAYLCLALLHAATTSANWNKTKLGCQVLATNNVLQRTVSKLGFGAYLPLFAFAGLLTFGVYTSVCVLTLYKKALTQGSIAGGQLFVLQRLPESLALFASLILALMVCASTLYSLCQVVQLVAVVRWSAQPKKEHNFLLESFWVTCRYLLGSVCLHSLLAPLKSLLEMPATALKTLLQSQLLRRRCLSPKILVCIHWLLRKLHIIEVSNFVMLSHSQDSYFEMGAKRIQRKRDSYGDIMECDRVVDHAVQQISLSLAIFSCLLQLILIRSQLTLERPLEFELLLLFVYAPVTFLFTKCIFMSYQMSARAIAYLGLQPPNSSDHKDHVLGFGDFASEILQPGGNQNR